MEGWRQLMPLDEITSATYPADGAAEITKKLRRYDSEESGWSFYSKKRILRTPHQGWKMAYQTYHLCSPRTYTAITKHYHPNNVGLCYKVHLSQNCDGLCIQSILLVILEQLFICLLICDGLWKNTPISGPVALIWCPKVPNSTKSGYSLLK